VSCHIIHLREANPASHSRMAFLQRPSSGDSIGLRLLLSRRRKSQDLIQNRLRQLSLVRGGQATPQATRDSRGLRLTANNGTLCGTRTYRQRQGEQLRRLRLFPMRHQTAANMERSHRKVDYRLIQRWNKPLHYCADFIPSGIPLLEFKRAHWGGHNGRATYPCNILMCWSMRLRRKAACSNSWVDHVAKVYKVSSLLSLSFNL
jgi:hypothetical protein